jgi:hypothetical protein
MRARAALLFVLAFPCLAEAQATTSSAALDVVSLERIRRGLAMAGPLSTTSGQDRGRPVFRLRIDESIPREPRFTWDTTVDTAVSPYVRPRMPGTHYEYLRMTTPEEFRASTLYSAGPDLLSPSNNIVSAIRGWLRQRQEEEVRRRIKEELAALKKAQGIQ